MTDYVSITENDELHSHPNQMIYSISNFDRRLNRTDRAITVTPY
uniref:Uncharacterized protein n=1 Tax=Arundo donax TaxID=35708 RepID=A0A0A9AS64_ARUDO